MSRVDILSDALNKITMYEKLGKKKVLIDYVNKVFVSVLKQLHELGYVKSYAITKTNRGDLVSIELMSKINKVKSIRPRYSVQNIDFEKYEKRYLPARNFGFLIVSTPKGVMTHDKAKKQGLGGVLLAVVY